jgi:TolB protein
VAHDVFISHAAKDKPTADAVCAGLEAQGIRVWIAPRDIRPGQNWGEAIIGGIGGCKAMVLIFSSASNSSKQVVREVERAVAKGVVIVPFRIDTSSMSEAMEYFLSSTHWLDAYSADLQGHIAQLVESLRGIVPARSDTPRSAPVERLPAPAPVVPAPARERLHTEPLQPSGPPAMPATTAAPQTMGPSPGLRRGMIGGVILTALIGGAILSYIARQDAEHAAAAPAIIDEAPQRDEATAVPRQEEGAVSQPTAAQPVDAAVLPAVRERRRAPENVAAEPPRARGRVPQRIAVVPFTQPAEITVDLAEIVAADLTRSGLFTPLPVADMLEKPTDIAWVNFGNWRAVSVDNVVVGSARRGSGGEITIRFQLLDVLRSQQLAGYDVPLPNPQRARQAAHQIADLIYETLTGVSGYFNSQIAYVASTDGPEGRLSQVVVADADGSSPVTVATTREREGFMSLAWSPDRRQLAYVGFERGRPAIYLHTLATGELRKRVAERGSYGAPAWSPDGKQLALTLSHEGNPDIYVMDVASGTTRQITQHVAIDTEPAWSPDGKQIAFTSDRDGHLQVYLTPSSGGEAKRITFEGKQNLRPRFSPDGKSLALVNVDDTGHRIGLLNLASRQLRMLSAGPRDEGPSFAPNGAVVIYAAQGRQGMELATVTVDGRTRQRMTQPGDVREPAWSPPVR